MRNDISAPAPRSTTSILIAIVHFASVLPAIVKPGAIVPGITFHASRSHASTAPNSAEYASALAALAPLPAAASWIERMVSAVAVPVGNGSASLLISWRLIGIAANTPSAAITPNHAIIPTESGRTVVAIISAPNAAMLPPAVM